MRRDQKVELLRGVPLFAACNDKELKHIASLADEIDFASGRVLTQEGRTGSECFVIVDGKAVVAIEGEEIAVLGPGEVVGEMALLDGGPRTATVTADGPLRTLVLGRRELTTLLADHPSVTRKILASIAQRLRVRDRVPV